MDTQHCCKSLRPNAKVARFCSVQHKNLCKEISLENHEPRGRREALEQSHIRVLFGTLLSDGATWAAALLVLEVSCGQQGGDLTCQVWLPHTNLWHSCGSTPSNQMKTLCSTTFNVWSSKQSEEETPKTEICNFQGAVSTGFFELSPVDISSPGYLCSLVRISPWENHPIAGR